MFISRKIIPKQLIIGLGTGRCGTKSLAYLLNEQEDSSFSHEIVGSKLTWKPNNVMLRSAIYFALGKRTSFSGDVAFNFLSYVDIIKKLRPECKFIVMMRDREDTINSYMNWTRKDDLWIKGYKDKEEWYKCYPNYPKKYSKEERIGLYWDEYYWKIDKLIVKYPDSFWIMKMEWLNDKEAIEKMLDFCGFPEKKVVIFKKNEYKNPK